MHSKDITVNFGDKILSDFIPQTSIENEKYIPLILPNKKPVIKNIEETLLNALENPIGKQKTLSKLIKENYKGGTVSIIVDDHDRPNIHTRLLYPILLEKLISHYKIPSGKIKAVISTGTHRPSTKEEMEKIFGKETFPNVNYVMHKCLEDNVEVGIVEGQLIKINGTAFNSDIVILLTDIENHYFAGVAGGPKALCPGICDMPTIRYEHLKAFGEYGFAENVDLGIICNNPVYDTKTKIVKTIVDSMRKHKREVYTITSIIDTEGDLVYLKGGEIFESHREATEILKDVWTVKIKERADIVISGAAHWGINLYQMGKATHCAYHAVKKGGMVLNVAPCNNGWGNEEFKNLMKMGIDEINKNNDKSKGIKNALSIIINNVKNDYKIGKQKPIDLLQILDFVGWGNLHLIQDGIPETDYNLLPFLFWGNINQPVIERLKTWIEKYLNNKTVIVTDNPNYLIRQG
ncbi:MAG: hypothetical protein A2474_06705 [Elusimicrobia bacterium RIFOXYC2_FULL_34_12]|nr:MAG: hypothetical protein A2474_06705 [Elusimicrobia bacterium RIFOXYC2_FULL_34_12]HAM38211.1 hypothetical protein [Elusimicrobiota bacterium]